MAKFAAPFLRTAFNYDMLAASDEDAIACADPSLAQQQFLEESDINTIVRRFNLTGELPSDVKVPSYGDFTGVTDFQSALNLVMQAEDGFMRMPAEVRSRFDNDPAKFLDFVEDPANRDEAISLGLVVAPAAAPSQSGADVKGPDEAATT